MKKNNENEDHNVTIPEEHYEESPVKQAEHLADFIDSLGIEPELF